MKTETHYVYWIFCEYTADGVDRTFLTEQQHNMAQAGKSFGDYTFMAEVELPPINQKEVTKHAVKALDKDIGDLQLQINVKQEKKQQLLALEYVESND